MEQLTQPQKIERIVCGIINRITVVLLASMVAITLVAWLAVVIILAPTAPESIRIHAARVTWAYITAGDILRKELHHD